MNRRTFLTAGFPAAMLASAGATVLTPDSVHRELIAGNRRFAGGHGKHPHSSKEWAARTARGGQHPHAVVLCCSDSRVAPEILFDQGLGDLFVVRVGGNVVREDETASIEYAVAHLSVPLCLVLGHTGCGAVQAVVDHEEMPVELHHLVHPIRGSLDRVRHRHPGQSRDALVAATVRANVEDGVQALRDGPRLLADSVRAGRLRIEGAIYDLASGRVSWL